MYGRSASALCNKSIPQAENPHFWVTNKECLYVSHLMGGPSADAQRGLGGQKERGAPVSIVSVYHSSAAQQWFFVRTQISLLQLHPPTTLFCQFSVVSRSQTSRTHERPHQQTCDTLPTTTLFTELLQQNSEESPPPHSSIFTTSGSVVTTSSSSRIAAASARAPARAAHLPGWNHGLRSMALRACASGCTQQSHLAHLVCSYHIVRLYHEFAL